MELSNKILSDVTAYTKYARYVKRLGRKETFEETIARVEAMHISKYPDLSTDIVDAFRYVYDRKVLPSMRSLQFAGKPILLNPARQYNCSYLPMDSWVAFGEIMFLLLGGTGVGYSVERRHVEKLPTIRKNKKHRRFLIGDSIEGWADAVRALISGYTLGSYIPRFDFSDIRPKGAALITAGGKAPGPEPLKAGLEKIEAILQSVEEGAKLTPLQVHDINCHIADTVLSGGIRRAAMIALFDRDEEDMLECKSGTWWVKNPQRGRANNSVVLPRNEVGMREFKAILTRTEESHAGEPGVFWTNDKGFGTNPCAEIALRDFQFCNLTTVNASNIESQEDLENRVVAAAIIGTLQASYTDFHFLRPIWKEVTEAEALLGVSLTGIADGSVLGLDLKGAAIAAVQANDYLAGKLGINKAARVTTIKPEGTSSLVLGTASGVHARHSEYYLRRMRLGKNEGVAKYLMQHHKELLEQDAFHENQVILTAPQKSPEGSALRTESPIELLERTKFIYENWILPGHSSGENTHNVSVTVNVKPEEWKEVKDWMWANRESYSGISLLDFDGGTYTQAPFEEITKEEYEKRIPHLSAIDLTQVVEVEENITNLTSELACAGANCEVT